MTWPKAKALKASKKTRNLHFHTIRIEVFLLGFPLREDLRVKDE
jgi:hypothetical protein